ncbi:MAG: hypothetical protein QXG35_09510 [Nitrososphaerota archaeon]
MSKTDFFSVFTPIAVDDLSSLNILVDAHGFDDFAACGYVEWAGLEENLIEFMGMVLKECRHWRGTIRLGMRSLRAF